MIVGLLISLIYGLIWVISYPIRALDDASLPSGVASAISTAGAYLGALDDVIPVATTIVVFGIIVVVEGSVLLWGGFNWLLRRLPSQS